jgi:hypothetical protein
MVTRPGRYRWPTAEQALAYRTGDAALLDGMNRSLRSVGSARDSRTGMWSGRHER